VRVLSCRIDTRQQGNFHLPLANLRKYQKGISYIGTRVYNNLPLYIKAVSKDLKKSEKKKIEAVFTNTFFLFITGIFLL
jgi:hypothetical protein